MKKNIVMAMVLIPVFLLSAFMVTGDAYAAPSDASCWGQASKLFAQMGEMGDHASSYPNPRDGLRNLARLLADAGVIPDDSMQSLGWFVATELNLSIDACGTEF